MVFQKKSCRGLFPFGQARSSGCIAQPLWRDLSRPGIGEKQIPWIRFKRLACLVMCPVKVLRTNLDYSVDIYASRAVEYRPLSYACLFCCQPAGIKDCFFRNTSNRCAGIVLYLSFNMSYDDFAKNAFDHDDWSVLLETDLWWYHSFSDRIWTLVKCHFLGFRFLDFTCSRL